MKKIEALLTIIDLIRGEIEYLGLRTEGFTFASGHIDENRARVYATKFADAVKTLVPDHNATVSGYRPRRAEITIKVFPKVDGE
jgi:hypothetical protein